MKEQVNDLSLENFALHMPYSFTGFLVSYVTKKSIKVDKNPPP